MDDSKAAKDGDSADEPESIGGGGQSGGGAYPNPHGGKEGGRDGYMGTGGQTEMPYHGSGQLGADDTGGNANAPASGGGDAEKRGNEEERRG